MSESTSESTSSSTDVKAQLKLALTAAMRARDESELSALRQALSAIAVAETAGSEATVLADAAVLSVLAVEVRKHLEAADAFETAGRPERVAAERAEAGVLERYLPEAMSDDELAQLVRSEIDAAAAEGNTGMKAMGRVVSAVRAKAGTSADGAAIATMVKAALS